MSVRLVRSFFKWTAGILVGTALGVGLGLGADLALPDSPITRGVWIGERRLPPDVSPASWLADRRAFIADQRIILRHGDEMHAFTFGELGIDIDIEATLHEAERVAHQGGPVRRIRESIQARRGEVEVPLTYMLLGNKARAALEKLAPALDRTPADARLDLESRKKIPHVEGQTLDVEATLALMAVAQHADGEVLSLVVKRTEPAVTTDDLSAVDIERIVSSYETTFHTFGTGVGRSVNIQRAARYIDGLVVKPGEVFSFNHHVGPRTIDRGFTWAPEIQGDEMTTGVGGGTCQTSSTLFAAALFGALEIVERRSHSRPSSYAPMGLDATVAYPSTDLQLRNNLSFPIMIHAFLPKPGTVRVEILGGNPVAKVKYAYGVGRVEDFVRRITVKSFLSPGKRIKRQKGSRGYDVTSLVTISYFDGRTEERNYYSGYRPAPEVFWVAPGYDEAELPPLPDHAKGIEGRQLEDATFASF